MDVKKSDAFAEDSSSDKQNTANIEVDSKKQIAEAVREIHQTALNTGGLVDPKIYEKDDIKFVFRGTEDELCSLIKKVVLEDDQTRAYAETTDARLKKWAKALEKEEEESREREQLISELERELELLRIEYEAVCQQRKNKDVKTAGALNRASQAPTPSVSVETDDDIQVIEEKMISPTNNKIVVGSSCYALKHGDLWKRATVLGIYSNETAAAGDEVYRVKIDRQVKMAKRNQIAYECAPERSVTRGTRVIALYKELSGVRDFYSGIVAEPPYTKNSSRYLIFFDDGCAQYTQQSDIRVINYQYDKPWHGLQADLQEFVKHYMKTYSQRMILKLGVGQSVSCEKSGKWLKARCLKIDCSLVKVLFEDDNTTEWIYRGSTRFEPLYGLQHRQEEMEKARSSSTAKQSQVKQNLQPALGVKRTAPSSSSGSVSSSSVLKPQKTMVYRAPSLPTKGYAPNRALITKHSTPYARRDEHSGNKVKVNYPSVPSAHFTPHRCGKGCIKIDDHPSSYKGKYALSIPIYVGFERYTCRTKRTKSHYTSNKKFVVYRGPCGRRIRNNKEMGDYLSMTKSNLTIDLFSFEQSLLLFDVFEATDVMMNIPDISHGKEQVPISCVNALNTGRPDPLVYSGVRMPQKDVDLNTNPDFMVCCDCTDNCQDKTKCACQQLTYEGQKFLQPSLPLDRSGYIYRRLDENIVTGVYECNNQCKCRKTCFNRVVQNPLSVRLQIFKTEKRGWGLRCLDDVPNGGFICIYAGQLLSEEGADQGGREYGDEYFAELDFIETCENVKEGYEEDVVDPDASSDEDKKSDSDWEGSSTSSEVSNHSSKKQLRPKNRKSDADAANKTKTDEADAGSKKSANEQSGEKKNAPKSIRSYFDEDLPYVMDAKTSGNLGRYLNHSCDPNVFVQNVFVDTHDPRFPWIAFFANTFIRAGTELTWDYGYQPGIVEGKVMYCYCGSSNCRGRLL